MPILPRARRCPPPARSRAGRRLPALVLAGLVAVGGTAGPTPPSWGAAMAAADAVGGMDLVDPVGTWPLRPGHEVVAGFDPPTTTWGAGHRGVDLLGRTGEPVRAALAGRVTFAGRIAGRGVVVVDHGGTRTTYEPVHPTVGWGAEVRRGAVIGTLDLVGSHCFPRACLHWGWLRGATYLDPLRLVGVGPVRLLPLAATPAASVWVRPWGAPVRRPAVAGPW